MQRIPQALQHAIEKEGRRSLLRKRQPLEELDFLGRCRAAEGGIPEVLEEPGLRLGSLPLDEFESLRLPGDDRVVQDNLEAERRQIDIPGLNQRFEERDAALGRDVEYIGVENLSYEHPPLLVAAPQELLRVPRTADSI